MEYYDIVFEGLSSSYVDRLLKSDLKVSEKNVIHSHLYDREKGDMIFQEKYSLNDFFRMQIQELYLSVICFWTKYTMMF